MDPIGSAKALLFGGKGFYVLKKAYPRFCFRKFNYGFSITYEIGKSVKGTPLGSLRYSLRGLGFSRFQNRPILARIFESSILVSQHILNWKDLKVDLIGSALVPPLSRRVKRRIHNVFLKTQIWSIDTTKMERLSSGHHWVGTAPPFGGLRFSRFQKRPILARIFESSILISNSHIK